MKKSLAIFLSVLMFTFVFAGCTDSGPNSSSQSQSSSQASSSQSDAAAESSLPSEPVDIPEGFSPLKLPENIRVGALSGPTAMGMVKLMKDSENSATVIPYSFKIGSIDEMVPLISKGELDIASVPANLASVLYNNTQGKVKVIAINTLGVLYVVEKGESVNSIADLAGKTIYATGKGATPELAINYILTQNGIDPASGVNIEFKSEPAEIIPLLAQNENAIAVIPQPFVTTALSKVDGLKVALDLTQEWDKVANAESSLITGVVVVNAEFAATYPQAVELFLREYASSAEYANTNVAQTAALIGEYGIVPAEIAEKALPQCNIVNITGQEMQTKLSGYLSVLFEQNPQSVGGTMPDEEFYYIAQ